jgi:hypothetical protein
VSETSGAARARSGLRLKETRRARGEFQAYVKVDAVVRMFIALSISFLRMHSRTLQICITYLHIIPPLHSLVDHALLI